MALTKAQKAEQLQELKEKFGEASSVIFAHYIGLKVGEVSELRRKLREGGAEMKVAKKTLMKIAAKDLNMPELTDDTLEGPVACIFGLKDPIGGAQALLKYSKDHPQVAFLGGVYEGKLMSKTEAKAFASLPSRQVLLGTFAGMIQSPLSTFGRMCASPLSSFARALSEMSKKGVSFAPAAA